MKFVHSKSIFCIKKCLNLSKFFSYQFRITLFDNFNFGITLFTKMASNFCQHNITDNYQKKHFATSNVLVKMNLVPNVVHINVTTLIWLMWGTNWSIARIFAFFFTFFRFVFIFHRLQSSFTKFRLQVFLSFTGGILKI